MKKLYVSTLFLFCTIFYVGPAYAYLDPGASSMILQGLVAGLLGGVTFISLFYTKIKKFFLKLLGRDTNDNQGTDKSEQS